MLEFVKEYMKNLPSMQAGYINVEGIFTGIVLLLVAAFIGICRDKYKNRKNIERKDEVEQEKIDQWNQEYEEYMNQYDAQAKNAFSTMASLGHEGITNRCEMLSCALVANLVIQNAQGYILTDKGRHFLNKYQSPIVS